MTTSALTAVYSSKLTNYTTLVNFVSSSKWARNVTDFVCPIFLSTVNKCHI